MIAEQTVHEIQEHLDIIEVIGGYISLKKAGRNFKALCPFHPEKSPSFMVYPQKQFFICYGCHAGGDLISFVMRFEHLEFPEAVRILAEKAGVPVPQAAADRPAVHPDLYRAHEVAARYYHELLVKSAEGERARAYLKGRGVDPAAWEVFSLGYAPDRWDGLLTLGQQEDLTPQILEKAGLAIPREGGSGWYDRFRSRVIFPIWDGRGRVIAFGGRVLEDAAGPKYMNSPETELYVKGRVLYGLHLAAPQIRERDFCIVVEGYMDLVSPYQHGIRNVVASMGTSLTIDQVKLIRRHTKNVVMVYDGDYAGEMATLRGLDLFLEAEMRVKVAGLPGGLDPDSMIKSQGVQAFIRAIQESQDLFDYKLGLLKKRFDPKQLEGRIQICQEMLPTIKRVPSPIQRGEYVKRLSELAGVDEALLWSELKRVKLDAPWRPAAMEEAHPRAAMTAEDLLAGLLLERPDRLVQLEGRLDPQDLQDLQVRRLVTWLMEGEMTNRFPRGSEEWESRIARWLAHADAIAVEEKERALDEVLQRIKENQRRAYMEGLKGSIRRAEEAGDEAKTTELVLEYNRFMKTGTAATRQLEG
ncbi:MAG: DNA primase [Candidatus Omnitrophica bacterium]|nr:DNA primase [Candidatus Omnitrophota bacterium]